MSNLPSFSARLHTAFSPTSRGVIGLMDAVLSLAQEQPLRLDWQANTCRVRLIGLPTQESIKVPLQKAVFRALLARVATLCNEHTPNAVTPYGGEAELSSCSNPPARFRVSFTNTPEEQRLEVRYVPANSDGVMKGEKEGAASDSPQQESAGAA